MNAAIATPKSIGFVGLGVMGEPMCCNLAKKRAQHGAERIVAFDLRPELLALTAFGEALGAA
jgi:3-hydroxyisobutyrate dehydrogenase